MSKTTFTPETPFMTVDGNFIYCLYQDGWHKGEPSMINDVAISITSSTITQEQKELITEFICDCLNEKFTVKKRS